MIRIDIDCSFLHAHGEVSGIQRVVRHIMQNAPSVGQELGITCRPVVFREGRGFVDRALAGRWGGAPAISTPDVLLLPDASWGVAEWDEVEKVRASGTRVGAVVYDLIPLQAPELFNANIPELFRTFWSRATACADFFVTLTESVRSEISATGTTAKPVLVVPPGADFDLAPKLRARRAIRWLTRPGPGRYALVVGTLEPRKDHRVVLDAFERLWRAGDPMSLVVVGHEGWQVDELVRRLRRHAERGRRLHWFDDANNAELEACYRAATVLVAPSVREGCDLPVVEARARGVAVIASDIAVHREMAGSDGTYFSSGDADALAMRLREHHERATGSENSPGARRSWEQSCRALLRGCLELAGLAPSSIFSTS